MFGGALPGTRNKNVKYYMLFITILKIRLIRKLKWYYFDRWIEQWVPQDIKSYTFQLRFTLEPSLQVPLSQGLERARLPPILLTDSFVSVILAKGL